LGLKHSERKKKGDRRALYKKGKQPLHPKGEKEGRRAAEGAFLEGSARSEKGKGRRERMKKNFFYAAEEGGGGGKGDSWDGEEGGEAYQE